METLRLVCGGAIAGALGAWLYLRSARAVLAERLAARERQIQDLEAQGRESKEMADNAGSLFQFRCWRLSLWGERR